MTRTALKATGVVFLAAMLALAGCAGKDGAQGPAGPPGQDGQDGQNGSDGAAGPAGPSGPAGPAGPTGPSGAPAVPATTGTLTGTVTMNGAPVAGVTVKLSPVFTTTTTAANGTFTFANVLIPHTINGVAIPGEDTTYTVTFEKPGSIVRKVVTGVQAKANTTVALTAAQTTVTASPITLTFDPVVNPAGFGQPVTVKVTATGTTGTPTYTWSLDEGPYTAAKKPNLVGSGATATFTTNTFADVVESGAVKYPKLFIDNRAGFVPVGMFQVDQMAYAVEVTVNDGTNTQIAEIEVLPLQANAGVYPQLRGNVVPVGLNLVANDPKATSWNWSITASPAGAPAATVQAANTQFPVFTPTAAGTWTLKNTATNGATLTVVADTFRGLGSLVADSGAPTTCAICHPAGANTPMQAAYTRWTKSLHADYYAFRPAKPTAGPASQSLFRSRVTGGTYKGECMACHVVGFVNPPKSPAPTSGAMYGNGGFGDIMVAKGWTIPTTKVADPVAYWNNLDTGLKGMSGVQCENCHGPLGGHTSAANAPTASFSAGTCLVCHDEPSSHEEPALWKESPTGHANADLAMLVAGYDAMYPGLGKDCDRCHTAQGFAAWRTQVTAGVSGEALLPTTPVTAAEAQPQTCQTCHDSHGSALRVKDDTGMLPAGFAAYSMGEGALCMTCHNSHAGAHGEGLVATAASDGAPHTPTQADMLMGQNAYFVEGYHVSSHAFVADSCVGCHMKFNPVLDPVSEAEKKLGGGKGHSFLTDTTLCANCHPGSSGMVYNNTDPRWGPTGTSIRVQDQVRDALDRVAVAMGAKLTGKATSVVARKPEDASVWAVVDLTGRTITSAQPVSFHGTKALILTLDSAVNVPWQNASGPATAQSLNVVTVKLGELSSTALTVNASGAVTAGNTPVILAPVVGAEYGDMSKAIWNYLLVAQDKSLGVHNPSFALEVLQVTEDKVNALGAAPF